LFLPDFSIKRPVAATMMVAALAVFGLISLGRLGISLFPDVDFPLVTVSTTWENARPEEVDNEITDELEDAIAGVSGIKHIISQSMEGQSWVTIEFELSKDLDVAAQEVRDKISARLHNLPAAADIPVIDKLDIGAQPIMWLAVTGQQSVEYLTKIVDEQIRPLIQKIQGVGGVFVGGGREKEVHIFLHRQRLAAYNIGVDEVMESIRRQHVEIPGGKVESRDKEFLIRTMGEFETPESFNDLIVAYRNGTPVRVRHIGYAKAGREESMAVARYTTKEGTEKTVALGVAPRSGANEVAIAKEVRNVLPEIAEMLPEGMRIEVAGDSTRFIENSINEVKLQLLVGGIMAALVVLLFLQNIRTTLVSSIAIPISIIATFACIYAMDFTLNNLTLLALVTSVGLVIDDAIVMVENIFRHRHALGKGPMDAAFEGSEEVGFAVVVTTVALAGVFIPVAFMGGIVGRFFFQFAMTMVFAVSCSTFVALTVVPMLSSRLLTVGGGEERVFMIFNRVMNRTSRAYRRNLSWLLRHRFVMPIVAVAAVLLGIVFFLFIGKEFVTAEDQGRFLIQLEGPLVYSMDKTDEIMGRLEERLRQIPEIDHFFSIAGSPGGGVMSSNKGIVFVTMVSKSERTRTQEEVQSEVRAILREVPDIRGSVSDISPFGTRRRNEKVQFVIQGPDITAIDRYSRELMDRLAKNPGYVGITRDLEIGKPEIRVRIDREKAADAGVSVRSVAVAVGALLGGVEMNPTTYKEGGKSYDIRLRLVPEQRILPEDIRRIWIRSADGKLVDISGFVTIHTGVGPSVINRMDRQRSVTIYANLEGKVLGEAMAEVEGIARDILPDGYSSRFSGRAEAFSETFVFIAFAFGLAIVLTYMVLAAQFESLTQPFAIMMGLPLSFVGAFGLLFVLGNTLNLYSMIAMILLVGLVTKNAILLIDYTNQLRAKGATIHEALVEAGATRLRPILMTAISTIAGVLPVALGIGVGSESRQPLAVAIAGGMLSSTILTLVVIPVTYSYLEQFAHIRLFQRLRKKIMAHDGDMSDVKVHEVQ